MSLCPVSVPPLAQLPWLVPCMGSTATPRCYTAEWEEDGQPCRLPWERCSSMREAGEALCHRQPCFKQGQSSNSPSIRCVKPEHSNYHVIGLHHLVHGASLLCPPCYIIIYCAEGICNYLHTCVIYAAQTRRKSKGELPLFIRHCSTDI